MYGSRRLSCPAHRYYTNHLLDMLHGNPDGSALLPSKQPFTLGSDLVAYGAAAKLHAINARHHKQTENGKSEVEGPGCAAVAGGERLWSMQSSMSDSRVATTFMALYKQFESALAYTWFRRDAPSPTWLGRYTGATVHAINGSAAGPAGAGSVGSVRLYQGSSSQGSSDSDGVATTTAADAVFVAGRLIPNSELMVEAGLHVELPSRQPVTSARLGSYELSERGWFVAGNVVGHVCPAQWCQFHGRWVSRAVARHVRKSSAK